MNPCLPLLRLEVGLASPTVPHNTFLVSDLNHNLWAFGLNINFTVWPHARHEILCSFLTLYLVRSIGTLFVLSISLRYRYTINIRTFGFVAEKLHVHTLDNYFIYFTKYKFRINRSIAQKSLKRKKKNKRRKDKKGLSKKLSPETHDQSHVFHTGMKKWGKRARKRKHGAKTTALTKKKKKGQPEITLKRYCPNRREVGERHKMHRLFINSVSRIDSFFFLVSFVFSSSNFLPCYTRFESSLENTGSDDHG